MPIGRGLAMEASGRRGMAGTQAVSAHPQLSSEPRSIVPVERVYLIEDAHRGMHPIDLEHPCSLGKVILDIEGINQTLSALGHQIFDSSCQPLFPNTILIK